MIDLGATSKITLYAVLWGGLLLLALAILSGPRHRSMGLPFAFLMMYTQMHAGALVHLVEGYDHHTDLYLDSLGYTRDTVADGLEASFLALLGAFLGFLLTGSVMDTPRVQAAVSLHPAQRHAKTLVVIGVGTLILEAGLHRIGVDLPGLQAVMVSARDLSAVGALPIILYFYVSDRKRLAIAVTAAFSVLIPAVNLVTTAILADSIEKAAAIFAFCLTLKSNSRSTFRRNLTLTGAVVLVSFVFATFYLQMRGELRGLVWGGGSISGAAQLTVDAAEKFNSASSQDYTALAAIDGRLNQNIYIGLAIEQLRSLPNTYENGDTIILALFGWVPRFVWPDKPVRGGAAFLTKHTGKEVQEGVSFGAGPVFELYVNFAYWGVFLGFIVLGSIVRAFDIHAIRALDRANVARFAQYYLAGLAMVSPLADLFFIVTAVASSLVVGWGLRRVWKQPRGRVPATLIYPSRTANTSRSVRPMASGNGNG